MWKMIYIVLGTGVWTQNLLIISLFLLPIDQVYEPYPIWVFISSSVNFCKF